MSQSSDEGVDATPTVESVNARLRAQIAGMSKDAAQGDKVTLQAPGPGLKAMQGSVVDITIG